MSSVKIKIYKAIFEEARESYPGKKRGFKYEWQNFLKKYKSINDRKDLIFNITDAVDKYKRYIIWQRQENNFDLRPCSFSVYINQYRYQEEYTDMEQALAEIPPKTDMGNWRERQLNE